MIDAKRIGQIPLQILGPAFLLCALAFAAKFSLPFDLLFLGVAGLYLCARWELRGCAYACILLALYAAVNHSLISSHHLWHLGLEGSFACAFLLTAFSFEQETFSLRSLQTQIETGAAAFKNLEEEFAAFRETAVAEQSAAQEKLAALRKDWEDLQAEHASLLILNDVLRKTSARHAQESAAVAANSLAQQQQIGDLLQRCEAAQKELARLKASDALALENERLVKEKEQTQQVNETLARLHAKESLKAKESIQRIESLLVEKMEIQEQLAASRTEVQIHAGNCEQVSLELDRARSALQDAAAVYTRKNFLEERLQSAETELELLRQKASAPQIDIKKEIDQIEINRSEELVQALQKERVDLLQHLALAEEKMRAVSQTDSLYKQLRQQFEEKNQVLHQVRSELFKKDTELQKCQMELHQAALHSDPVPRELQREIATLEEHASRLEEENRELLDLVSFLSELPSAERRKKKVKTPPALLPEQDSLF